MRYSGSARRVREYSLREKIVSPCGITARASRDERHNAQSSCSLWITRFPAGPEVTDVRASSNNRPLASRTVMANCLWFRFAVLRRVNG